MADFFSLLVPVVKPGFDRVWRAQREAADRANRGSVADSALAHRLLIALRYAYELDVTIEAGLAHVGLDVATLEPL